MGDLARFALWSISVLTISLFAVAVHEYGHAALHHLDGYDGPYDIVVMGIGGTCKPDVALGCYLVPGAEPGEMRYHHAILWPTHFAITVAGATWTYRRLLG